MQATAILRGPPYKNQTPLGRLPASILMRLILKGLFFGDRDVEGDSMFKREPLVYLVQYTQLDEKCSGPHVKCPRGSKYNAFV